MRGDGHAVDVVDRASPSASSARVAPAQRASGGVAGGGEVVEVLLARPGTPR